MPPTNPPGEVDRAAGYGMPGVRINGMDAAEVYQATSEAVDRARVGEGPTLIEAMCHRFRGHYEGDPQIYRTEEETRRLHALDPPGWWPRASQLPRS